MKIFIILLCFFAIPTHLSAQAAPNLYQTLEEVDQFDFVKVIAIRGREASILRR